MSINSSYTPYFSNRDFCGFEHTAGWNHDFVNNQIPYQLRFVTFAICRWTCQAIITRKSIPSPWNTSNEEPTRKNSKKFMGQLYAHFRPYLISIIWKYTILSKTAPSVRRFEIRIVSRNSQYCTGSALKLRKRQHMYSRCTSLTGS